MTLATRTWPRLTPAQKELMIQFDKSRYGDLHICTRGLRTAWCLKDHGMIVQGSNNWYSITQRGRDFVRFGMRKKKKP